MSTLSPLIGGFFIPSFLAISPFIQTPHAHCCDTPLNSPHPDLWNPKPSYFAFRGRGGRADMDGGTQLDDPFILLAVCAGVRMVFRGGVC